MSSWKLRMYYRTRSWQKLLLALLLCLGLMYVYLLATSLGKHDKQPHYDLRRRRYEDYKASEDARTGPGEQGMTVELTDEERKRGEELFKKEAFNIVISDKISLERSVPDVRDPRCKSLHYPEELPTASVIIIFHNEAWSPLLRTVHSVVNRSPPQYLHEVILLDDFSDRALLGVELEEYVKKTWPDGVVKIARTKKRSGLIVARLEGAKVATGDVMIFLDSHCEVNKQWLEPLLARINEERTTVLCPSIDNISDKTLHYGNTGSGSVGGFWWSLHFSWHTKPSQKAGQPSSVNPVRLEPLLSRILEDRRTVLCPLVDSIDDKTLEYSTNGGVAAGGFMWSLHFTWMTVPPIGTVERKFNSDPIRSPTMPGGLFAIDRKFFFEIGSYDDGMEVWGGENLEMSFRVWMCGGTLEFIPCSRVGHIFRASHPYTFPGKKDTHGINSMRLAEVWMDGYKRLFYMHRQDLLETDYGNITERKLLRERLKCKSFKWYLDNVYPEKFIIDENVMAWGMVRNPASNMCLDTLGVDEKTVFQVGLYPCQYGSSAAEVFSLSLTNELRREEACMDTAGKPGTTVHLKPCHGGKGNQEWKIDKKKDIIVHVSSGNCLDQGDKKASEHVVVNPCNGKDSQQWTFENYLDL